MNHRYVFIIPMIGLLSALSVTAAPDEKIVQGLYEGSCKAGRIEARVVAQGDGNYKVLIRRDDGKISRIELTGSTDGDSISFTGKEGSTEWNASYSEGKITGNCGDVRQMDLKRVERLSPNLGRKAPDGAIVLIDGKSFDEMVRANGSAWYVGDKKMDGWAVWEVPIRTIAPNNPSDWPSKENIIPEKWTLGTERRRVDTFLGIGDDGSVQVPGGGMNSKRQFEGSFDYHVEFMCPLVPKAHSQGRGNSGVFLPNGDEIQVLDSFGETTYLGGGCGGFYKYKDPDTMDVIESIKNSPENKYNLTSSPPLQWQTYDVEYRVQKINGEYKGKPSVTVYHNGIKIHDNAELSRETRKGSFNFQDHGNPVRYRNVWVLPLPEK